MIPSHLGIDTHLTMITQGAGYPEGPVAPGHLGSLPKLPAQTGLSSLSNPSCLEVVSSQY